MIAGNVVFVRARLISDATFRVLTSMRPERKKLFGAHLQSWRIYAILDHPKAPTCSVRIDWTSTLLRLGVPRGNYSWHVGWSGETSVLCLQASSLPVVQAF